jgi:hypothetical protein
MSESWSRLEIEAAVADYFAMLCKELRGESFNKAEHNRRLRMLLRDRTKGSVEKKHQNISAVMIELGYPYICGYKPLKNYQELLREVVEDHLEFDESHAFDKLVQDVVADAGVEKLPAIRFDEMEVKAPEREVQRNQAHEAAGRRFRITQRNYLELEARNQSLGAAGELVVMEFEHQRLWNAGRKQLANKIEQVSRTQGDHLGFDILSYEVGGRERLIEVKTTRFGIATPFFVTLNELSVSRHRFEEYHLYRLFNFERDPKIFRLEGSLEKSCTLHATEFRAMPFG